MNSFLLNVSSREVLLSAFGGWFIAVAGISLITGTITRSAASVAYALVMLTVAALEFYAVAHGAFGGPLLGAALQSLYLIAAVAFAFTLLGTRTYAPTLAQVTTGMLLFVIALIAIGDVWPEWSRYYVVDRVAVAALLIMLAVLGARAVLNEVSAVPAVYISALFGPILGIMVWSGFAFDWGLIWESMFFACAVALRNHGLERERDRFAHLASNDGLTGVANRRTFDDTLERVWTTARRANIPLAVAMIDIDHFKKLNDTRGHQYGDECLRRVAAVCSSLMRRGDDCFARYGGEEFAAIMVHTDVEKATVFAENLRRAIEQHAGVTVSIGIAAIIPDSTRTPGELVRSADQALYRAKSAGRNCVRAAIPTPASPTITSSARTPIAGPSHE